MSVSMASRAASRVLIEGLRMASIRVGSKSGSGFSISRGFRSNSNSRTSRIKGVEIGMGFEGARRPGSEVHDAIYYSEEAADWDDGHGPTGGFYRKTNRAGGLEGGMTNG